jgi:pSer/pThr/pTyr-binding forkhead associated (FHA) protein
MLGQLVPCGGGPPIALHKPKLLVGRQNSCDIPLPFGTVSGRHCELEFVGGFWFVRDLGSSNGTRVNGALCTNKQLMPNDVLSFASYRFTILYTPPRTGTPMRGTAITGGWGDMPPQPLRRKPEEPSARPTSPPPAAGTSLGRLVPCGGGDAIPLRKTRLIIGRHPDCDIVLPIANVSGKHCQLDYADGQWSVRDLGSRNGTRVDAVLCQTHPLPPGCVLAVAGLRFEVVYGDRAAAKPARASLFGQSLLAKLGLFGGLPSGDDAAGQDEDMPKRYKLDEED